MNRQRFLVLLLSVVVLATPAQAGLIFRKKPKVDPAQRVPELLGIVKTSPDESKRADAADEMRKYDPAQFPEMVPTLIEVLQNDAKPSVRLQAVSTLARFRPVSQEVGMALEQALAKDSSMRVRLQARSSLLQYHWAGYHTPKNGPALTPTPGPTPTPTPPPTTTTREPPLAPPLPISKYVTPAPLPPSVSTVPPAVLPSAPPPPPAPPIIQSIPMPAGGAQRMPVGPIQEAAPPSSAPVFVPIDTPRLQATPSSSSGPGLGVPY